MKKLINKILISLFLIAWAQPVYAKTISIDDVLKDAIINSYNLKLSRIDIDISQKDIKAAKSSYMPTIQATTNAGYTADLANQQTGVTSVGNDVLLNNSIYQNTAGIGLAYNIYDFGVKKRKLNIAKFDKLQKETAYDQQYKELKITILDLYAKALLNDKELEIKKQILALRNELLNAKERLYESRMIEKSEALNERMQVSQLQSEIDTLTGELAKDLKEITYYTQEDYDVDDIKMVDLREKAVMPISYDTNNGTYMVQIEKNEFLDLEKIPEYKYYQLEIEKKKKELEILKRSNLPKVNVYSNYYMYGQDKNGLGQAFQDIQSKNWSVRVATVMPLFDGFNNKAQQERTQLEIKKLEVTREAELAKIMKEYEKLKEDSKAYQKSIIDNDKTLSTISEYISTIDLLDENRMIDKVDFLTQKLGLLSKKYNIESNQISNYLTLLKLNVYTDYTNTENAGL